MCTIKEHIIYSPVVYSLQDIPLNHSESPQIQQISPGRYPNKSPWLKNKGSITEIRLLIHAQSGACHVGGRLGILLLVEVLISPAALLGLLRILGPIARTELLLLVKGCQLMRPLLISPKAAFRKVASNVLVSTMIRP